MIGGGYTQSGKTTYKAALAILGNLIGFSTIVVTTTGSDFRVLDPLEMIRRFTKPLQTPDQGTVSPHAAHASIIRSHPLERRQTPIWVSGALQVGGPVHLERHLSPV